jgi:branched-chain amino acid transport system substrate-binding protein
MKIRVSSGVRQGLRAILDHRGRRFLASGVIIGMSILLLLLVNPIFFRFASSAEPGPIKIGVLEPLSGVYTNLGEHALRGMKTCFEQRGWTVAGRKIEVIAEDTELNPQVTMRKARKLVEKDEIDLLLGLMNSPMGVPVKDYAAKVKRVFVACGAGSDPNFKKANNTPYGFGARPSNWQISATMGRWLAKSKGYKRVFITGPDYALGQDMSVDFKDGWSKAGGPKPIAEVLAPINTNDFAPYLTQIKNAAPEAVFASFAGGDAVRFVKQFYEFGLSKKILLTGFGYLTEEDVILAEGDAAVGVHTTFCSAYGVNTPENKAFKEYYEKHYHATPTADDYVGYGGALAVYEALKKVGGNTKDQLALSKTIQKGVVMTPYGKLRFDPETNNGIFDIHVREVRKVDGKIHNYVVDTMKDIVAPHD